MELIEQNVLTCQMQLSETLILLVSVLANILDQGMYVANTLDIQLVCFISASSKIVLLVI